ncbi:MAG TPA: hypothetical protein VN397_00910 [Candidatus Methylomirabilis sp.]|nr:hypothetical protein [Candidatus Methylomirabilis sp.]
MNEREKIRRENTATLRRIATAIVQEHGLKPDQFCDEGVAGRPIYRHLIDLVWPKIVEMSPHKLGEIASCGNGNPANCFGVRTPAKPSTGTSLAHVHASSQFWLGADWDGMSLLRIIAASAIIAEICDQLDIDARSFMNEAPRRSRPVLN